MGTYSIFKMGTLISNWLRHFQLLLHAEQLHMKSADWPGIGFEEVFRAITNPRWPLLHHI
jgi:hypothetical protein